MIRILSHAEIFSFAAVQSGNMDWRVFMKTNQAKPNPSSSSSSRKSKAKSGKNKTKFQETPTIWTDLIHVG